MAHLKSSIQSKMFPSMKIIIVGDSSVGKSALMCRYCTDEFSTSIMPTIGVEHRQKDLLIEDIELKLNIWDTTGQEKYRAVTATFFKGSSGCLIVFDLSHRGTFAGVERWLGEVQSHAPQQTITILVGNKQDLGERQVTTLEAEAFAKKHGMEYFETSAQTGHNVKAAFERLVAKIWERNAAQYRQFKNNEQKRLVALTDPPQGRPGRKRCCSG